MDGGRTAAGLRDMAADRLQRLPDAAKRSIIERAQTALQPCASGNCIADASGLHAPEAEQTLRSLRKRQCRGAAVKLHAGCKCVTARGGGAEMCAAPLGGERHLGRARHHGAGQTGDHPGRKTWPEVQGKYGFDAQTLQDPCFAKPSGAAGRFLGGLKQQQNVVRKRLLRADPAAKLQRHRHVPVVSAGVHFSAVLRGKRQPRPLRDGQRVHFRAKCQRIRRSEVKISAHSAVKWEKHLAVERAEDILYIVHGLGQLVAQLGDAVQGASVHCHGGERLHI